MADARPTICFAVDRAHAESLREGFSLAGVSAAYLDGNTPLPERGAIYDDLQAGRTLVVCCVDAIGFGVDWPEVSCISYARPTRSEIRFVQNIGRGLRPSTDKIDLLILDHSDTSLRLGFVSDIHHDVLSNGKERLVAARETPLPKLCTNCQMLRPRGLPACPNCGHVPERKSRPVNVSAGELEEFDGIDTVTGKGKKARKWSMEEKKAFYAELLYWEWNRNFKRGWSWHKYKAKFGIEPQLGDVEPKQTSYEVQRWISAQNIKWARSKRRFQIS